MRHLNAPLIDVQARSVQAKEPRVERTEGIC